MSGGMIGNLLSGMDAETASEILSNLDNEMIEKALTTGIEDELVPHLETVRENASNEYRDAQEVRDIYESLDEEEQTERFHRAAADIMNVAVDIRESPIEGMSKLKGRLRDPWVVEGLLLIFDHDDVPDEVVAQQKEFAAAYLKYIGVHVIPEIYERGDLREMVEQMYPNDNAEDILDELEVGKDGE